MRISRYFETIEEAKGIYGDDYIPKINEKTRTFADQRTYYKLGSTIEKHSIAWQLGRLFDCIIKAPLALCSGNYLKRMKASWKEFKQAGLTVSIYVKKQLELKQHEQAIQPPIEQQPKELPIVEEIIEAEPPVEACLNVFRGLPDVNDKEFEPLFNGFVEFIKLNIRFYEDKEALWNQIAIECSPEKAIYMLHSLKIKLKNKYIIFNKIIEKDLKKFVELEDLDHLKDYLSSYYCYQAPDELVPEFVRELTTQNKIELVLQLICKNEIIAERFAFLGIEELKKCLKYIELEKIDTALDSEPTKLTNFFQMLTDFSEKDFLACYDVVAKHFPEEKPDPEYAVQALHGFILMHGSIMKKDIVHKGLTDKNLREQLDQVLQKIDRIINRYPEIKDKLEKYLKTYPKTFFVKYHEMNFDPLRLALIMQNNKNYTMAQIHRLTKIDWGYYPAHKMAVACLYLDPQTQRKLIHNLYEHYKEPFDIGGARYYKTKLLKDIYHNLTEEELNKLALPDEILQVMMDK